MVIFGTWKKNRQNEEICKLGYGAASSFILNQLDEVQLFWQGHKDLRNLPYGLDIYFSKRPNHEEDCAKCFGFLRKA